MIVVFSIFNLSRNIQMMDYNLLKDNYLERI